ncbi:MAG: sodium-translocating pyrophosphatase [Bdellovibrionales bacterium]|nr:sodium-translocating pyrophosphatase [Bdellovibrionales bacterium]
MIEMWTSLAPLVGVAALVLAAILFVRVKALPGGNARMTEISGYIREGAMAFLAREYKILVVYSIVVGSVLGFALGQAAALSFLLGAGLSLVAGLSGMQSATLANVRTAQAAKEGGRGSALMVAFDGGAVMGLAVAGLGILGLGGLTHMFRTDAHFTSIIHGFGVGASSIALFARIGGGIYTKAADVGADLAGKVIAGIPEDDPRNPGVIADNVGDNVGDVAGMGADIFESYVAATVSAMAIALTTSGASLQGMFAAGVSVTEEAMRVTGSILPLMLAAVGLITSIIAIVAVRFFKNTKPALALRYALLLPPFVFLVASYMLFQALGLSMGLFHAVIAGALGGGVVGLITDYYTSAGPVMRIAESAKTGAGTNVIRGLAVGLESVIAPMLVIALVASISYVGVGLYGIAIAAVAMLAVTAVVMTVDAYGPIADNAGGIAEMSELGKEIRDITDELDAVGNTTAAIGKGFAIGSAVLTVIALFAAYKMEIDFKRIAMGKPAMLLDLTDGRVLVGLLIGSVLPCVVGASTMTAVGKAAGKIVEEIRRQFKDIPGLLEGRPGVKPETAACVDLATRAALSQMILPGVVAILAPPAIGFLLGAEALAGALAGAMVVGAVLSLFMANAGGAWDNAKKTIEKGALAGEKKGSDAHKAAVVGDTVGDPFKDTSGPGIAILIKVMSVVSLMIASLLA